jgi:hypothetical protein
MKCAFIINPKDALLLYILQFKNFLIMMMKIQLQKFPHPDEELVENGRRN